MSAKIKSEKQFDINEHNVDSKILNNKYNTYSHSVDNLPKGLSSLLANKNKMDLFEIKEYKSK